MNIKNDINARIKNNSIDYINEVIKNSYKDRHYKQQQYDDHYIKTKKVLKPNDTCVVTSS